MHLNRNPPLLTLKSRGARGAEPPDQQGGPRGRRQAPLKRRGVSAGGRQPPRARAREAGRPLSSATGGCGGTEPPHVQKATCARTTTSTGRDLARNPTTSPTQPSPASGGGLFSLRRRLAA